MSISQAENADPVTPEANLCLPCKSLGPVEGLDLAHTAGSWRRKRQRVAGVTQTCSLLGISLPVSSEREWPHAQGTWNKSIAYRRAAVMYSRSLTSQSPEVQVSVPEWRSSLWTCPCLDNLGVLKAVPCRCHALESLSTKPKHLENTRYKPACWPVPPYPKMLSHPRILQLFLGSSGKQTRRARAVHPLQEGLSFRGNGNHKNLSLSGPCVKKHYLWSMVFQVTWQEPIHLSPVCISFLIHKKI